MTSNQRKTAARRRMFNLAHTWGDKGLDPVHDADMRTSMNDARTALCIAYDVDPDDIDPTTGHNYSRRAYETVRQSWIDLIAQEGLTEHNQQGLHEARAMWAERRPEWTANDPWISPEYDTAA